MSRNLMFLESLQDFIEKRKETLPKKSYTSKLFRKGMDKIAKKFGEEAIELVIAAKNKDNESFLNESADLVYHLLVMLTEKGYRIEDVVNVLEARFNESGLGR